jgi:hypothetical protein
LPWDEAFRRSHRSVPRHLLLEQRRRSVDSLAVSGIADAGTEDPERAQGEIFKSRFLQQVRLFPSASGLIQALHGAEKKILFISSSDKKRSNITQFAALPHGSAFRCSPRSGIAIANWVWTECYSLFTGRGLAGDRCT